MRLGRLPRKHTVASRPTRMPLRCHRKVGGHAWPKNKNKNLNNFVLAFPSPSVFVSFAFLPFFCKMSSRLTVGLSKAVHRVCPLTRLSKEQFQMMAVRQGSPSEARPLGRHLLPASRQRPVLKPGQGSPSEARPLGRHVLPASRQRPVLKPRHRGFCNCSRRWQRDRGRPRRLVPSDGISCQRHASAWYL